MKWRLEFDWCRGAIEEAEAGTKPRKQNRDRIATQNLTSEHATNLGGSSMLSLVREISMEQNTDMNDYTKGRGVHSGGRVVDKKEKNTGGSRCYNRKKEHTTKGIKEAPDTGDNVSYGLHISAQIVW